MTLDSSRRRDFLILAAERQERERQIGVNIGDKQSVSSSSITAFISAPVPIGTSDFTLEYFGNAYWATSGNSPLIFNNNSRYPYEKGSLLIYGDSKVAVQWVLFEMPSSGAPTDDSIFLSAGDRETPFHFVVTRKGTTVKAYFNGELKATKEQSAVKDLGDFRLGMSNGSNMVMSRIYNYALSAEEVAALYNDGDPSGYVLPANMKPTINSYVNLQSPMTSSGWLQYQLSVPFEIVNGAIAVTYPIEANKGYQNGLYHRLDKSIHKSYRFILRFKAKADVDRSLIRAFVGGGIAELHFSQDVALSTEFREYVLFANETWNPGFPDNMHFVGFYPIYNKPATGKYYIKDVSVISIGCIAEYLPQNISSCPNNPSNTRRFMSPMSTAKWALFQDGTPEIFNGAIKCYFPAPGNNYNGGIACNLSPDQPFFTTNSFITLTFKAKCDIDGQAITAGLGRGRGLIYVNRRIELTTEWVEYSISAKSLASYGGGLNSIVLYPIYNQGGIGAYYIKDVQVVEEPGIANAWLDSAKQLPLNDKYLPPLLETTGGYDLTVNGMPEIVYPESSLWYGIEYDVTKDASSCVRIGDMSLHQHLPIQSRMRGCLLDDSGKVIEYLPPADWMGKARDGSHGQVMIEIPRHYRKHETEGNIRRTKISEYPLPGYHAVPKMYISAYEASMERSTGKLCSVANSNPDFRGGNDNTAWDGTYRSLLGRPVTRKSRTQFRTAARLRNGLATSEWNCLDYTVYKAVFWLYCIEYANRNCQLAFNPLKDANGFAQGGLGTGVTNMYDWIGFNEYYPFVPCGHTDELGNGTGEVAYSVINEDGSTQCTVMVPRYRGIENPFGHIWQCMDGINIRISPTKENGGDGLSKVFVCTDPAQFKDDGYDGYTYVGDEARANGYVKEVIFNNGGEIMPSVVGGSPSTYFCDYHYTNIPKTETLRSAMFGGRADYGANAGFVYALTYNTPLSTGADIGSRLCFIPQK